MALITVLLAGINNEFLLLEMAEKKTRERYWTKRDLMCAFFRCGIQELSLSDFRIKGGWFDLDHGLSVVPKTTNFATCLSLETSMKSNNACQWVNGTIHQHSIQGETNYAYVSLGTRVTHRAKCFQGAVTYRASRDPNK